MKLSELQAFFVGEISDTDFHDIILADVSEYERRRLVRRGSNPIAVVNDTENIVTQQGISHLCSAYLRGTLSEADLAYVADALLLSNFAQDVEFIGNGLSNLIGLLTDPEVNGPINKERVMEILTKLSVAR